MASARSGTTTTDCGAANRRSSPDNLRIPKLCHECRKTPMRYKCPRCDFLSCSLACCRAHKVRTGCSGRRDATAFVRLRDMTDGTVVSDYHFLEDVGRTLDTGKRILSHELASPKTNHKRRRSAKFPATEDTTTAHPLLREAALPSSSNSLAEKLVAHHSYNNTPRWVQQVLHQRGVKVLCQPPGMQRQLRNRTRLDRNTGVWHWTIEWAFHLNETPQTITTTTTTSAPTCLQTANRTTGQTHRVWNMVAEDTPLQVALADAIGQVALEGCSFSISAQDMTLLLQHIPQRTYSRLDNNPTLRDVLTNRTVIEFPTLHVVPPNCLSDFPLAVAVVEKELKAIDCPTRAGV